MDPAQALAEALRSLAQHDTDGAIESLEALTEWLKNDGFAPSVSEALRRACLDDLGLDEHGRDHVTVRCPSYWEKSGDEPFNKLAERLSREENRPLGWNEEDGDIKPC